MIQRLVLVLSLISLVVLPSCGGLDYMRPAEADELPLASAPANKALVNFHRPSNYGGAHPYEVFDRTKVIGNTQGKMRFQYVCEPGEHIFIGVADRASAIRAELAAGEVYDVVVNITPGWMQANITLEALVAGHPKRAELSTWEEREELWYFLDDEAAASRSERRREWAQKTLTDFLGGSHADRLQELGAGDER